MLPDASLDHTGERSVELQPQTPWKRGTLLPDVLAATQELRSFIDAPMWAPHQVASHQWIGRVTLECRLRVRDARRRQHEALRFPSGWRDDHVRLYSRTLEYMKASRGSGDRFGRTTARRKMASRVSPAFSSTRADARLSTSHVADNRQTAGTEKIQFTIAHAASVA